ncbi:acyl dehydratase [Halobacteriales archaeon SW_10_68_16]|nr:MAG: acyl dehydratase [Halobacteriales archaeon SW_10_68_16]
MDETYEAVEIGQVHEYGTCEVTREEIVAFAEQYDPQPFHVDPEAARESMFGGLVASGWHTCAMTTRLLVDNYLNESGGLGSPGIESLRFPNPVYPGDALSVRTEHTAKETWDESRGVAYIDVTTHNQDDEMVLTMEAMLLYPREG